MMVESTEFASPVVPDRADQPVSETTERFLRAILERIPLENIEEVHLFSPLRQGTVETGVAVVASCVIEAAPPIVRDGELELELVAGEVDAVAESGAGADADSDDVCVASEETAATERPPIERHTVYTARYRLVVKGPERGRWESDMVEEADAPLITVETVVRGVQRRAGEDSEIIRFNARQIARALRISPES